MSEKDYGNCFECGITTPPVGVFIGFFGAMTSYPKYCRPCTTRLHPEMLGEWDRQVNAEQRRRTKRK